MVATATVITSENYFSPEASRLAVSHSELEEFRDNPQGYYQRYVSREIERKVSPEMEFGTAVHSELLDPPCKRCWSEIPAEVLASNGAKSGAAWKGYAAENQGRILLKAADVERLQRVCDAVRANESAKRILGEAIETETAYNWLDEGTGLSCRAKMDGRTAWCLFDVKVTVSADPMRFTRRICEGGYHRQAAFYRKAVELTLGQKLPFVFIAVEPERPHRCEVVEIDDDFLWLGERQNIQDLAAFAECRASGVWQPKTFGQIVRVSAPRWATNSEWEFQQ